VTIRLLDPPLHEFLPHSEEDVRAVAAATGLDADKLMARAKALHETNPMLGHRGCRLGVAYPEIYEMQVRAIIEAALEVKAETGAAPMPEIMHPLVAKGQEMKFLRELTDRVTEAVFADRGDRLDYLVGTMIELPRAALRADDLAEHAEFFSFGTNDLTQTTFGISRDDSGRFLQAYLDKGIFEHDPFVRLDPEGVGDLIRIAAERGKRVRPNVKLGICGEHGGDPSSIAFCEGAGLDYVSCSPYRVPIARLAAAQAALSARSGTEREKDR
jgi:pyruvate,orthophosphate dikinase